MRIISIIQIISKVRNFRGFCFNIAIVRKSFDSPVRDEKSGYQKYLEDQKLNLKNRSQSQGNRSQMEFGMKTNQNNKHNNSQRRVRKARNQES